jgi:hypothetical protein
MVRLSFKGWQLHTIALVLWFQLARRMGGKNNQTSN